MLRFMLGTALGCFLIGGAVALLATNGAWATTGAAFCIIGTPISLLYAASVWFMDRRYG